jgi:hypothetical protein
VKLDLAGRKLAVYHRGVTLHHLARYLDNRLDANILHLSSPSFIEHDLGLPVIIPKIHEHNATVVTLTEHPTRKGYGSTGV